MPGVYLLTGIRLEGEPLGVALAFANAGLFALYIVLAHRAAQGEGVDALGAAMLIAAVVVTPLAGCPRRCPRSPTRSRWWPASASGSPRR